MKTQYNVHNIIVGAGHSPNTRHSSL